MIQIELQTSADHDDKPRPAVLELAANASGHNAARQPRQNDWSVGYNAILRIARLDLASARPDRLLPDPGFGWIGRVLRARRSNQEFQEYASNGEKPVLLLREVIAARRLEQRPREIVVEVSDALIELGVKGATFLHQDLVRHAGEGRTTAHEGRPLFVVTLRKRPVGNRPSCGRLMC